jgi:competence protein ComGC
MKSMKRSILAATLCIFTVSALATYHVHSVRAAKQAILEEDRRSIESAVRAYTLDQGHAPQTLDDLVDAGYLKSIPGEPLNLPNSDFPTKPLVKSQKTLTIYKQ